ncbi:MAG: hypothetical protein ACLPOO_01075 [Terriglobales bacterium]|jgi:uncharacterized membrane protein
MNMLHCSFQFFHHARLALALAVFPIHADVFWPYFTGAILLVIGLPRIIKDELPQKQGLDKILPFGPLFFALPMGVFATQHFINTKLVATIVPSWMPWHTFWVYLVGVAVMATALSIILEKHARLAATLFGCMLLLFVALIHIPNLVATHGARLFWVIALRDLAFSGGAFAMAGRHLKRTPSDGAPGLVTLWRFFVGIPAIVFGVEHFLHPAFAPGIPMEAKTPTWIPGHLFWAYLTGAALIACGACIVVNKKVRLAATYLTIVILLLGVFIYLPMIVANPSDVDSGLNNFVDILALSGSALVLADALGARTSRVTHP